MSTSSTAKRRRSQARKGYRHMAPLDRPTYSKRSAGVSAARLARVIDKQKTIAQRKGQKKS